MIQRTKADILALRGSAFAEPLPAFAQERLHGFGRERLEVVDLEGGVLPAILERLAGQLLSDYRLYLTYIESKPQRKAKVRSHKKMFYELRKAEHPIAERLLEAEIDVSPGQSLLAAVLELTADTAGFAFRHLLNANFRFAYWAKPEAEVSAADQLALLRSSVGHRSRQSAMTRLDYGQLAASLPEGSGLFYLPLASNDKALVEFVWPKTDPAALACLGSALQDVLAVVGN